MVYTSEGLRPLAFLLLVCFFWAIPAAAASEETMSTVHRRLALEQAADDNPFLLLPHQPNFILPFSYSVSPNSDALGLAPDDLDRMEIMFQVSLKTKMAQNFAKTGGDLYAAYTNRSWWQAFNSERSSPFRETNHEPELFLLFDTDFDTLGMRTSTIILGVSHQSNGQGGELSRSWNRIYLNLFMEKGDLVISLKPWYRIPEEKKKYVGDPSGDDNPDIGKYMGHGELGFLFSHGRHTLTLLIRNNFREDNKGAVGIGWSYPLSSKIKGYLRVFDGFGESLIDYDHRTTRIGLGFLLADWI
jgi:phospholipase A1